jgi:hypothetical protein
MLGGASMYKIDKVGKHWYLVKGDGIRVEVTAYQRTITPPNQPTMKVNRFFMLGASSGKYRNEIITAITEKYPKDFETGVTVYDDQIHS